MLVAIPVCVMMDLKEMDLIASVSSIVCPVTENVLLNTVDVNECLNSSLNDCDVNASCMDTFGSYMCSCNDGYFGNGFNCSGKLLSVPMYDYRLITSYRRY